MVPGVAVTVKGENAVVEILDRTDTELRGRVFKALLFVADRPQDVQLLTRPNRAYLVPTALIGVLENLDADEKLQATEKEADEQAAASRAAEAVVEDPPATEPESPQKRGARTRAAKKAALQPEAVLSEKQTAEFNALVDKAQ